MNSESLLINLAGERSKNEEERTEEEDMHGTAKKFQV